MAQYLPLPDGSSVTVREGETPQQAWARAQQMYPEAFQARQPQVKPEPTVGGQVKEFFKGVLPGGIGALESAAVGASALLPEDYEKQARAGIASIAGAAKKPFESAPGYEDTVGRKFGEASGSILPFLATGPLGAAGRIAGAGLGMGMGAGEARTRAEQEGATTEQRSLATGLGSVVGISEMFAPARILGRVGEPVKAGIAAQLKRIAMAGGEEAAQEAASQAAQNLIAKGIYKPEQEIIEQVGESAAYGGAVGALAQGLLDMALGRRAKGVTGTPDEIAQARAEANAQREELMRKRQDPAYAKEIEAKYNELEKQRLDLESQIVKGKKGEPLSSVDQESNKLIRKQLSELSKQLGPTAAEYAKVKPLLAKEAEAQRLGKLAPEDVMMDYLGIKMPEPGTATPPAMRTVVDEFGRISEEPVEKAPTVSELAKYAYEQIQSARESGQFMTDDYIGYLMRDPAKAAEIAKNRTPLPGLDKREAAVVYDGLKLQLKERERQRAAETKSVMEERASLLKAPVLPDEEQKYGEIMDFAKESRELAAEDMRHLDDTFVSALVTGQPVVDVSPDIQVTREAPRLRERIEQLMAQADQADREYRTARAARERPAAAEAFDRARTAIKQLQAMEESGGAYAKAFIGARRAQFEAMAKIEDVTDQLRSAQTLGGENKAMASSTEQSLSNEAARQRSVYITNALQEAALHRRAQGLPALTHDEAIKATSKMYDTFNDWVERAKVRSEPAKYEEKIVQPAQMRGTRIVKPAVTERVEVAPATQAISPAEIRHFQERLQAVRSQLFERPETKVQIESPLLRQQFAPSEAEKVAEARGETATTLGGELRRRTEYVRDNMARMQLTPQNLGKSWLGTRNALNAAADVMDAGDATRDLLDAVEPVVDAVLNRRNVTPADLQAIKDAMAAARPTAIEQKEEGQKSLFPETEEDLGYIRMTPANFAKSPRIKPVWEALDRARAAAKAEADKQVLTKQRLQTGATAIERIKDAMDVIEKDTQFFMKNTSRYTPTELSKALVPVIEVGATPEENALMDKYVRRPGDLTPEEKAKAEKILYTYRTERRPEYQARLNEAFQMLSKGEQIEALDNQLYSHMAGVNKAQREAAEALSKRIGVYKKALKDIQDTLRASAAITPAQRAVLDQEKQVRKARGDYQQAVERGIAKAYAEMDKTLAELLDPEIAATEKAVAEARKILVKEKAELDKIQKRVQAVLAQPEGKDRMQLATYQQFKYEEKASIIKDLEERLEKEETHLRNVYEARHDELDSAQAVAMAMADKQVKEERNYLEIMEGQLANLRGDNILEKPNLYPFSAQRIQANIDAQKDVVKTAEKRVEDIKERVKTDKEKVLEFVQNNKLPGIRKEGAVIEPLLTEEQKRAEKLRKDAERQYDQMAEAARVAAVKQIQLDSIDEEVSALILELGSYENLPDDPNTLKALIEDENTRPQLLSQAVAKAGILQNIETLEAQRDAIEVGKPSRKPRAATVPTTAVQAAQKPFITGDLAARSEREFQQMSRSEQREANLAAQQARGKKAPKEPKPSTRKQESMFDENIGLFEDYEPPDLSSVFRTSTKPGAGLKEANVAKIADKVVEGWERVPQIAVVADESGLPPAIQEQARKQNKTGQIPGVFDPNTETVYLVASNLKDGADVALTIAHEVLGHYGLRAMLGKDYSNMMQRIYDGNENVRKQASAKMDKEGLSQDIAVEEVLAEMAEKGDMANAPVRNALRNIFYAIKQWFAEKLGFKNISDNEVKQLLANARRYVKKGKGPIGLMEKGDIVFRTAPTYVNDEWAAAGETIDKFVAKNKSWVDKVKANTTGLAFETQLVDRFAGYERLRKYMDEHKGTQMMYYMRMYDQRMNMVSQAVGRGAPQFVEKTRPDGNKEYIIEAKEGPSIKNVVQILRAAQPMVGNGDAVNRAFTMYMAAIRADNKGFDSLNFGKDVTPEMLKETQDLVKATPGLEKIFNDARDEYNAYNRNLVQFVADSGAISQELADTLLEENDYIPFYRERNGVAELVIGSEAPIRIGSTKEQPYLHELLGGDQPILDFMTSSVQNTNMLLDMGLRNMATKNAVFELLDLGAAKFVKKADGPNVVQFKDDGETKYAVLSTEKVRIGNKEFDTGVPADILIKGMEGIPTQMPLLVRAMAVPAQLLRKSVTLSPLYMARQLFRDSLAAPLLSGADFTPVIGALRQIGKPTKDILERRGITGGQQFTGSAQDISKILRDISDGKSGWMEALGKFEAMGMEADALTRRAQYNSYIEQGMSEMEATLMSLESMNFNKRGASPSVHWANALIPFFNAQIQGLNVLYKAMSGKMPFNDKLRIREKLLQRGSMMAVASIAYALAMQDDEAYQNATPDQKYANWFVRVPGMDEPIRVPIPFEIGYIFKALPEALVNTMSTERGGEEALQALRQIVLQTIPGGSNYGIPQALKPAIEAGLGKSFYTGRDILSQREANLLPEEQFRANTTDVAKLLGKLGISPIVFENLVRGYTGTMGVAFLQALSLGVPKGESPEQATRRLSEYPVVGGAWQPNDAGGIANSAYERMNDVKKLENTINKMVEEGRTAEAMALMTKRGNEYMQAELGDSFRSNMQELTRAERAIQASAMTPQQKREQLDEIRKLKTALAKTTLEVADKTIRLSSQP